MRPRNIKLAVAATAAATAGVAGAAIAPIDTYADSLTPEYETQRVVSSGDTVPLTGDSSREYRSSESPTGSEPTRGPATRGSST